MLKGFKSYKYTKSLYKNTQILLETKNSSFIVITLGTIISIWQVSVNFMLENNSLEKSTGNSCRYLWEYNLDPI